MGMCCNNNSVFKKLVTYVYSKPVSFALDGCILKLLRHGYPPTTVWHNVKELEVYVNGYYVGHFKGGCIHSVVALEIWLFDKNYLFAKAHLSLWKNFPLIWGESMGRDWMKIGVEIVEKVLNAIEYWCRNISGDPVCDCLSAHLRDLYEVASLYYSTSYGISEDDLRLLEEMPDDVYEEINAIFQEKVEKLIKECFKEFEDDYNE